MTHTVARQLVWFGLVGRAVAALGAGVCHFRLMPSGRYMRTRSSIGI